MYAPRSWAVVGGLGGGMTLLLSLMLEVAVIATKWRSGQPCAGSDVPLVFEPSQESLHAARLIKRPERLKQDQGAIEESAGASEITCGAAEVSLGYQRLGHFVAGADLFQELHCCCQMRRGSRWLLGHQRLTQEALGHASEMAIAGFLADRQHRLEARARLQSLP